MQEDNKVEEATDDYKKINLFYAFEYFLFLFEFFLQTCAIPLGRCWSDLPPPAVSLCMCPESGRPQSELQVCAQLRPSRANPHPASPLS